MVETGVNILWYKKFT